VVVVQRAEIQAVIIDALEKAIEHSLIHLFGLYVLKDFLAQLFSRAFNIQILASYRKHAGARSQKLSSIQLIKRRKQLPLRQITQCAKHDQVTPVLSLFNHEYSPLLSVYAPFIVVISGWSLEIVTNNSAD